MILKDFFKKELETLHAKTGIHQLEKLKNDGGEKWKDNVRQLIQFMVDECERPPFDLVGVDKKMEIIRSAIVGDKDFIGLNAKFVYRALGTWWQFNKDIYFEKFNQGPKKPQPEPAPPEVREKYIQEWFQKLDKVGANFRGGPVLTPEEVKREGQEKPNMMAEQLDKLAPKKNYQSTSDERFIIKQRIREVCAKVYANLNPHVKPVGMAVYKVEGYEIFCESQQKAQEIYIEATSL